jgi:YidC/Oxa1 family membrane protein insertase
MDTKNVIAAISLSAAVIILYSLFFQPDPSTTKQNLAEQKKIENNTDTPSLDKNENLTKLSREDALKENDRIQFENGSVIGSISLKGAAIDDLTFKEYNIELNRNDKITLLSPRNVDDGYLIESGFVTSNKNIDVPDASTVWEVSGNQKLTNDNPIK